MQKITVANVKKLIVPLLKEHGVKRAGLFGSVVRRNMKTKSDVDILIKVDNRCSLLRKKVDLVEYSCIKPAIRKEILGNEVRIYEAAG